MRLIVDTNRLFAALVKESTSRKILQHKKFEFASLQFSLDEVRKYKEVIVQKARIDEQEFSYIFQYLLQKLTLIDDQTVMVKIPEAAQVMDHIDPDDTPFIAAALAIRADIWSDDRHFDKQKKIKIWKTKDLVHYI
jgi:predicted nucleic acid-binding protein